MEKRKFRATCGSSLVYRTIYFEITKDEKGWNSWSGFATIKAEREFSKEFSSRVIDATMVVEGVE